jgi:hypothetical protein
MWRRLYLNSISTNNCFSASERNPVPILILTRRSGVNCDPRGIVLGWRSETGLILCGLMLLTKGAFDRPNFLVLSLVCTLCGLQ